MGEPQSGFENADSQSPPVILKSKTLTRFKINSDSRNNLQNHRWLPVCRNKQFEEGYWKDFTISQCFYRIKPKNYLLFAPKQGSKIFSKLSAHIQKVRY
jgi:hypothetical protein